MKFVEFRFEVEQEDDVRVDKYLSDKLSDISRSQIKNFIEAGYLTLDDVVVTKAGTKAKTGSILHILIPEQSEDGLIPESIPLDIIYEDNQVIVINKPAGIVVHPGAGVNSGTLVNALLDYDPQIRNVGESDRPGVVHRLDKETSGVLIFARTDQAYRWLVKQFKSRDIDKTYFALVDGHPPTPTGRIEAPIVRDQKIRTRMAVGLRGHGKPAISEYFEQKRYENHSLLAVHPITGRTHQIRVHLSYLGTPVAGDTLYGHRKSSIASDRFFLHANKLSIRLPGDRVKKTFEAPLPEELLLILKSLNEDKRN